MLQRPTLFVAALLAAATTALAFPESTASDASPAEAITQETPALTRAATQR